MIKLNNTIKIQDRIRQSIGIKFYRLIELIDGEKNNCHLINYRKAEKIKLLILEKLIDD